MADALAALLGSAVAHRVEKVDDHLLEEIRMLFLQAAESAR